MLRLRLGVRDTFNILYLCSRFMNGSNKGITVRNRRNLSTCITPSLYILSVKISKITHYVKSIYRLIITVYINKAYIFEIGFITVMLTILMAKCTVYCNISSCFVVEGLYTTLNLYVCYIVATLR